ncbi:type II secretion system F family protein [Streptomyces sp. NPDC046465]|uniref:type II secretion system F family protein n=1 Tax=Streptomyces sp. NPDC046465 TaxID=3155810 RepID=UPI0033C498B2
MNVVHSLGVAVWDAAAVLWLALTVLAVRRERRLRRRAGRTLRREGPRTRLEGPRTRRRSRHPSRWPGTQHWLLTAGTASAAYALVGGVPGLLAGAVVGYGVWRRNQRTRASPHGSDGGSDGENGAAEASRQLPLAADLLAACVAAGASPVAAAHAVGESLRGPVGARLARGAAEVRLGGEPANAWRQLGALPGAAPLARLLERAGESGAPAAAPVARLAADARAERGRTATAGARRAAVLMTAPVGLCFLPAFVAVGVLPVVIGMAEGLLKTG